MTDLKLHDTMLMTVLLRNDPLKRAKLYSASAYTAVQLMRRWHLQGRVGFAGVGGPGVVNYAPLQRPRHGVPLVRLRQVHCLHEIPGRMGGKQASHAHDDLQHDSHLGVYRSCGAAHKGHV